jgi:hypothetical protein
MPKDDATLSAASVGSHVELRDHFAAAAMAGLIAEGGDWRLDYIGRPCIRAYEWADAMLRERGRTNHGASPEARARTDGGSVGTDKAEPLNHRGTGDTLSPIAGSESDSPQPVAWRAYDTDGSEAIYSLYEQARAAADEMNWSVEPLYRTPQPHATHGEGTSHGGCTLTPEERESVIWAATMLPAMAHPSSASAHCHAAVLRRLWSRLS